jgi:hypothetical protein
MAFLILTDRQFHLHLSHQLFAKHTHDAYAPRPIVLEIILKGKSDGRGSNCDCAMFSYCALMLWIVVMMNAASSRCKSWRLIVA